MRYLIILVLQVSVNCDAQLKSFAIGVKGDTINRVDSKGLKQGPWILHVDELRGERGYEEEGYYENDLREGGWRRYSLAGDLIAIESYRFGMKNGKCQYFTDAGEPLREESWRAFDPKSPYDTVDIRDVNDPSKILKKIIVKVEPTSYKNGTWTYYDTIHGTIEKTEEWVMNKPKEKDLTGDDMAPIDPANGTASTVKKDDKKEEKKPQVILDYEKKNAGKKKIKVRDGNTGG